MTKTARTPAAAPAPAPAAQPALQLEDQPTPAGSVDVRDVYAAQAMSAIVCGIVSRGGLEALYLTLDDDRLMTTAFRLADDAMQARDA